MKREFYEINCEDLMEIDILLDTDYENDWINIFIKGVSYDTEFLWSQFNEEHDLTSDRRIRISPDFALKIWKMVEETEPREVMRNHIKADENFNKQYDGKS